MDRRQHIGLGLMRRQEVKRGLPNGAFGIVPCGFQHHVTGEDDALWVGRMTYGSAVATQDGPIIAHGRRGKDGLDYVPPPWGFGVDFDSDGHLQFPFFTGDILWGVPGNEPNREQRGPGDSVNTSLSFQAVDSEHPLVARAIKQVPPNSVGGDISSVVKAGQIPLATFVELNPDGRQ